MCHKKLDHNGNLVSDAITALPPVNVEHVMQKSPTISVNTWNQIPQLAELDTNGKPRTLEICDWENHVRFQVLTVMSKKMAVFWDVAPCSLVETDHVSVELYCYHHQPHDGGNKLLCHVGQYLPDYTARPRRQSSLRKTWLVKNWWILFWRYVL
jgi:hypothetical protein